MAKPRRRTRAAACRTITAVAALLAILTTARAEPVAVTLPGPGGIALQGKLYRPVGVGSFPAVVALHGCGGLYDRSGALTGRHADWGERLSAQGFLVLFPDSFGSRGLGPQCRVSQREIRPGRERVADAEAAGAWLRGRPDVRPDAVSLLGWSNGGSTVLAAVQAGRPTPFARAVAFYPGCRTALERGWRDRTPLLILVGGADDWTGAEPCRALAEEARGRGEPVEITVYPGAVHDFDAPDTRSGRSLPDLVSGARAAPERSRNPHCEAISRISYDSAVRERRGLAYTVNGDGIAHTGTDPAARADALARVPAHLAQ